MVRNNFEPSLACRAAIITLRYEGRGWTYISSTLANCSPNGVQTFFNRILQRSGCDPNCLNLPLLLQHLEDAPRDGWPERFPEESEMADTLVRVATLDAQHEEITHRQVAQIVEEEIGVRIPYSTAENVFKKREIVRRVPPRKIRLDEQHRRWRVFFAEWALGKLQL